MKSVVVEASTVAKAIEIAWLKAEKPEEYFIRILQEHSSGFLGFGAQKAKIVLFFKNTNKSDSLFPVVLKQKEYTSFFGNNSLKVPKELNVVDTETNKNVSLGGGQQKKKPHHNQQQNNQQKVKQNGQSSDLSSHATPSSKLVLNKVPHNKLNQNGQTEKPVVKHVSVQHSSDVVGKSVSQPAPKASVDKMTGAAIAKPVHQQSKQISKPQQDKPKLQVTLQASQLTETKAPVKATENKDGAVTNIAKALKKVQSQKIIANVSRPEKVKVVTPKFESYEDYINAQSAQPSESSKHVINVSQEVGPVVQSEVEKIVNKAEELVVRSEKPVQVVVPVQDKPSVAAMTPRVPIKMKRRPLTTENPGVSGITRSVKTDVSSFVETAQPSNEATASADDKNEKE